MPYVSRPPAQSATSAFDPRSIPGRRALPARRTAGASFALATAAFLLTVPMAAAPADEAAAEGALADDALEDAVSDALDRSLSIGAAEEALKAARLREVQAALSWLPKATVTSEKRLLGDRSNDGFEVSARMPLFDFGRTIFTIAGTRADKRAARAELAQARLTTELEAAEVYLGILRDRKAERILRASRLDLIEIRKVAQARFRAGAGSRTDVAQVEADLEAFGNEIEQARLRQANAETAFRSITGREPGRLFAEPRGLENLPADLQQAKAKALESNPQVSQAYHRSAARRQAARAIFGEFLPRLDLAGSYRQDWDADDRRFADDDGWWVGLRVTVPLIEPEAVPAVLRSRADARRADFQSRDTRRRVARAVEETWNSRESAAERMATARRRIEALKEAEAGIRSQYIAGLRPLDDLLEVQVRTAQAELVELQAEQEHQLQGYRLLSLLGENLEVAGQQR